MQHWKIGGAFTHEELLTKFCEIIQFVDNPEFKFNVYDTPARLIWQGGRCEHRESQKNDEDFLKTINKYNDFNVGFTFVFSSGLINKEDFSDKRGNFFLESCHKKGNAVTILNDDFASYVRKHYPEYSLNLSITHMNRKADKDWYMKKFDKYDIIVLLAETATEEFLSQFEPEYIDRFEVMSNEYCIDRCNYRELHYRTAEMANKVGSTELNQLYKQICLFNLAKYIKMSKEEILELKDCALTYEQIDRYKELGIKHWKMLGREIGEHQLYYNLNHYIFREMGLNHMLWAIQSSGLLNKDETKRPTLESIKINDLKNKVKSQNLNLKYSKNLENVDY